MSAKKAKSTKRASTQDEDDVITMPRLVGVVHLPPLPGSPRSQDTIWDIMKAAAKDAVTLANAGFQGVILENFGDTPFFATSVPKITVSAMTTAALAVSSAAPDLALGINVLRNDAEAALAIAVAAGASFIRVNVLSGARVTDQGVVEGRAAELVRMRSALGAEDVGIWADVDVKHSAPLSARPLASEVDDLVSRSMADAVLVTGGATGKGVNVDELATVKRAARGSPLFVASGATPDTLPQLLVHADGVIVGSALRKDGKAGGPIDAAKAKAFAQAFARGFAMANAKGKDVKNGRVSGSRGSRG
ncbi:MAG: BtpA/SgcQ family protein [Polyangiaceae bacterium]